MPDARAHFVGAQRILRAALFTMAVAFEAW